MNIGCKINELRNALNMTLQELADKCDSSKSYIWEIENKSSARPSAAIVLKLSRALGVSMEFLTDDNLVRPSNSVYAALSTKDARMVMQLIERLRRGNKGGE